MKHTVSRMLSQGGVMAQAEGVQKPGAKGLALDASAWAALISNKETINAAMTAV